MIIDKILFHRIDVSDPCAFALNKKTKLLNILTEKFENKCYKKCLIIKVLDIMNDPVIRICQNNLDAYGSLDVQFKVRALVYEKYDVIHGCKVTKKTPTNVLICETKNLALMVISNNRFTSIREGQYISVSVNNTKYSIGTSKISVEAVPYLPKKKITLYYISEPIVDYTIYSEFLKQIKNELDEINKLDKNAVNFFKQMMFPGFKEPGGKKKQKLVDMVVEGKVLPIEEYVGFDTRNHVSDGFVNIFKLSEVNIGAFKSKFSQCDIIENVPSDIVFKKLLMMYIDSLKSIRELCAIYNSDELVKSHQNLWKAMK